MYALTKNFAVQWRFIFHFPYYICHLSLPEARGDRNDK